jgi:hypothetical protein
LPFGDIRVRPVAVYGKMAFPTPLFLLLARIMELDISNNPVSITMHHVNGAYFHNFLVHDEKNMGKETNNMSLSLDFATYSKVTGQEGQSVFNLYFDNEVDFRTFAADMQETLRVVEEKIKEIEGNITRELDMN